MNIFGLHSTHNAMADNTASRPTLVKAGAKPVFMLERLVFGDGHAPIPREQWLAEGPGESTSTP